MRSTKGKHNKSLYILQLTGGRSKPQVPQSGNPVGSGFAIQFGRGEKEQVSSQSLQENVKPGKKQQEALQKGKKGTAQAGRIENSSKDHSVLPNTRTGGKTPSEGARENERCQREIGFCSGLECPDGLPIPGQRTRVKRRYAIQEKRGCRANERGRSSQSCWVEVHGKGHGNGLSAVGKGCSKKGGKGR